MVPTVGFLGVERVLQRLCGVHGQDDATETGRRATPQTIVDVVRNRTLIKLVECLVYSYVSSM